jgi:hypothetical protein
MESKKKKKIWESKIWRNTKKERTSTRKGRKRSKRWTRVKMKRMKFMS